jgi:LPS export ABC transporter protein LptC
MSSPIPEKVNDQAKRARDRARRSQLLGRVAMVLGGALAIGFVLQSFYLKPVVKPEVVAVPERAPVISGSSSSFAGIDENSKPFQVDAAEGTQDKDNQTLMHLKTVTGAFTRKQGGEVKVAADQASYEISTKDLKLVGNVRFEEPGRYVAHLASAEVNLNKQKISTKDPVQVETANARVSADSMETSEDGKIVRLKGHVKASFQTELANK